MLNALGRFCRAAEADVCARCVEMGGAHEASRLTELAPTEHRAVFRKFLSQCESVIAPSHDTVSWARTVFADVEITAESHPQVGMTWAKLEGGRADQIVLLGAIGPHKGSRRLLELAREARLTHPILHFHVIGYTDIDKELKAIGNVSVTGPYEPEDLPALIRRTRARFALFLHEWPETFSYTLSEAWSLGLWPLVPALGAPAERILAAGWGTVLNGIVSIDSLIEGMESKPERTPMLINLGVSAPAARRCGQNGKLRRVVPAGLPAHEIEDIRSELQIAK